MCLQTLSSLQEKKLYTELNLLHLRFSIALLYFFCLSVCCFTSSLRIFSSYGKLMSSLLVKDCTIYGCNNSKQRWIFNRLLWHWSLFFSVSSQGPSLFICLRRRSKDTEDLNGMHYYNEMSFVLPLQKRMLTINGQRTTHDDGRQHTAIRHQSGPGDIKTTDKNILKLCLES